MFILILIGLFVLSVVIAGIKQYIREPKPPKYLNYRDYYNYYHNKEYLENVIVYEDNTEERLEIEKEIEFYSSHVDMLEDLQRIIENELHTESGNYKSNLSRLISLDKQIHTAQQKINKLTDKLENL